MAKDLIKPTRGLSSEMNKLQANELGFATDTKQLFIGAGNGAEPTLIEGKQGARGKGVGVIGDVDTPISVGGCQVMIVKGNRVNCPSVGYGVLFVYDFYDLTGGDSNVQAVLLDPLSGNSYISNTQDSGLTLAEIQWTQRNNISAIDAKASDGALYGFAAFNLLDLLSIGVENSTVYDVDGSGTNETAADVAVMAVGEAYYLRNTGSTAITEITINGKGFTVPQSIPVGKTALCYTYERPSQKSGNGIISVFKIMQ